MSESTTKHQPKVFLPTTPTEFTPSLLYKLESSLESDYTRSQYAEKFIQDRVKEELQKIQKESSESLKAALSEQKKETRTIESNGTANANKLREQLQILKSKLDSRPVVKSLDPEVAKVKESLIECFRMNKEKPLKCWGEVEAFKRSVGLLEEKN